MKHLQVTKDMQQMDLFELQSLRSALWSLEHEAMMLMDMIRAEIQANINREFKEK